MQNDSNSFPLFCQDLKGELFFRFIFSGIYFQSFIQLEFPRVGRAKRSIKILWPGRRFSSLLKIKFQPLSFIVDLRYKDRGKKKTTWKPIKY
ncbi:MAG: hypothetical protein C0168_06030 [Candidatus Aminicenantes bacterium]|nr:MAG: hypothetical protein C0168_06030 [Candidatus Aminicenantes bacterium]